MAAKKSSKATATRGTAAKKSGKATRGTTKATEPTKSRAKDNAAKVPGSKQVAEFVGLTLKPTLKAAQIQRLKRALPGYVSLLDDVAELIADDGDELRLKDVTPAALLDAQARQKELSAREAVLYGAYLSAYHQRLMVDDEAIGMLRAIARRVQSRAEENPDLPIRYKAMLDFLASFAGGPKAAKTEE